MIRIKGKTLNAFGVAISVLFAISATVLVGTTPNASAASQGMKPADTPSYSVIGDGTSEDWLSAECFERTPVQLAQASPGRGKPTRRSTPQQRVNDKGEKDITAPVLPSGTDRMAPDETDVVVTEFIGDLTSLLGSVDAALGGIESSNADLSKALDDYKQDASDLNHGRLLETISRSLLKDSSQLRKILSQISEFRRSVEKVKELVSEATRKTDQEFRQSEQKLKTLSDDLQSAELLTDAYIAGLDAQGLLAEDAVIDEETMNRLRSLRRGIALSEQRRAIQEADLLACQNERDEIMRYDRAVRAVTETVEDIHDKACEASILYSDMGSPVRRMVAAAERRHSSALLGPLLTKLKDHSSQPLRSRGLQDAFNQILAGDRGSSEPFQTEIDESDDEVKNWLRDRQRKGQGES